MFPTNPKAVLEVNETIRRIVKFGEVMEVPADNRPEFEGVLFWAFTASDREAKELKAALGSDVRTSRTKQFLTKADSVLRLIWFSMSRLQRHHTFTRLILHLRSANTMLLMTSKSSRGPRIHCSRIRSITHINVPRLYQQCMSLTMALILRFRWVS